MKIYNITKGQMIVLWASIVLFEIWIVRGACKLGFGSQTYKCSVEFGVFVWVIAVALIFYTLGWVNNRKSR